MSIAVAACLFMRVYVYGCEQGCSCVCIRTCVCVHV